MRVLPIVLSVFALAGCATTERSAPAMRSPASLDAARFYTGTWYEIGRRPMWLTDGCVAGGTTYTPHGEGRVEVRDFCRSGGPAGKLRTIGGPGQIVDPGVNAKLHVTYRVFGVVPVPRDYWVLERGEDYSWFISADPSFRDLWIYTRNPRPTPAEVAALVTRVKALGYDPGRLEFPATGSSSD